MQPRSGLFEAGTILILVGSIIGMLSGVLVLLIGIGMGAMGSLVGTEAAGMTVIGVVYIVIGVLSLAGSIVGFLGHAHARRGDARGAWVRGLVASLLPPVQAFLLVGAILCKVSPECKAQETGWHAQPPGASWSPR